MPYTRQQLLAAVRADHPQLANVDDNKLFAAVAVDHPDLAKGISELQAPPIASPPSGKLSDTLLGALTMGVDPMTFLNRIGGAVASVVNPLLPGGDTRQPNAQMPQMTTDQEIGAKGATLGTVPALAEAAADPLITALKNRLPSTARAGANFQTVMGAAKDVPIDTSRAEEIAARAQELRQRGSSLPKVLNDFIKQRKAGDFMGMPVQDQMTYEVGRDFATNAGALSGREATALNAPMQRQVGQFAAALKDANRAAAVRVDMGDVYDAAMKEYRQAKTLQDATEIAAKWGKRAVMAATLGASGKAGYDIYERLAR